MVRSPSPSGATVRTLAFLVVVLFAHSRALSAQDIPAGTPSADTQAPTRSPATARFLGTLFPGGGHIYAGEYAKGVGYFYGTASCIGGGALALAASELSPEKGPAWPMQASGVLLIGVGVAVWARGALDAPRAAARVNVKHSQATAPLSLVFRTGGNAAPRTNLGLAVAW